MPAAISPMVARRETLFMRSSARCASLSARRWSVMSSPESMTPVATLFGVAQCHAAPGDEPVFAIRRAHVVLADLRLVAAAHEQRRETRCARWRDLPAPRNCRPSCCRRFRALGLPSTRMARWLTSCTTPARSVATSITCARSRYSRLTLPFLFERRQRLAAQRGVVQKADELRRRGVGDAADAQEHREFAAVAMPHAHVAAAPEHARLAAGEISPQVIVVLRAVG